MRKEILGWIETIAVAVLLAFLINHFLLVNVYVPTGSMENTIMAGDRNLALRTSYWFSDPQRGDVVVFEAPMIRIPCMLSVLSALAATP